VKLTGATAHFVTEGTDEGPIILQKAIEISGSDTAESLQRRVMEEAEWKLLPEAISLFCEGRLTVIGRKVLISEEKND
jgi:phosphoribosylglycinamide formyltransferase-1